MHKVDVKCFICGTKYKGVPFDDCPYCGWGNSDFSEDFDEEDIEPFNMISAKEAKENLKRGLNVYGEPLNK